MRKPTFFLLILTIALFTIGADDCSTEPTPIPNPGFAIVSTYLPLSGFEQLLPGAVTTGDVARSPFGTLLGTTTETTGKFDGFTATADSKGVAYIYNAKAPALYRMRAGLGWGGPFPKGCDGQTANFDIKRGQLNYLVCKEVRMGSPNFGGPLLPNSLDSTAAPVQFTAYGEGITQDYDMPTFQVFNEYGTFVAQTPATSVDPEQTWATGWSACFSNLPTGSYNVVIMNATADGIGQRVGMGTVYLFGGPIQKPIDDASFFVRQHYLEFLHREPDQGGWEFWTGQLTACGSDADCLRRTRTGVSKAFYDAASFNQDDPAMAHPPGSAGFDPTVYNQAFVWHCYLSYLQRDLDSNFWIDVLNSTGDYNGVIEAFITSGEYRTRFDPPPPSTCNPSGILVQRCEDNGGFRDWETCSCN